ncbi:hypothetical protein TRFO_18435 [Tritrichomonas foetus]|uniref:RAVE complex protein Rav1 C-terminal domain-containing protein n=1 Tax=Tritrichomonas foetus TaxID=1144522 RepID=A0A1J4KR52_9EUKA|nr:hypothetical protein TRFO_18435 [Tritrichomonas foetus]|eukprot:OHT11949.1 hypothetical protein TRFO_18435 [Tritrichomonas foetus]
MTVTPGKSQIIKLRPNSLKSYDVSLPIHSESALFAFACENLIFVYNRFDFSENIIEIPDCQSKILMLTFNCAKNNQNYLFCVNDNNLIYQISLNDLKVINSYKIESTPCSITSSIDRIFYISNGILFSFYITDFIQIKLLENIEYKEVVSSPNGSAIALFTKGTKNIKIAYSPFNNEFFMLPLESNLIEFQWSCSQYLAAVTACEDMIVKIWLQQPNTTEMKCIGMHSFHETIYSVAFCYNSYDSQSISTYDKSVLNGVVPSLKRPKSQILVVTKNSMIICEETTTERLSKLVSAECPFTDIAKSVCDLFYLYSNGEIRKRFDITLFSKNGVFCHQIELTSKSFNQLTPYQLNFFSSDITRILPFNDHILVEMADGSIYDCFDDTPVSELTFHRNQFCGNISKEHIVVNGQIFKTERKILDLVSRNNCLIAIFARGNYGNIAFLKQRFISFDFMTDTPILSASIHSSDIFAVCTESEVICYIYDNEKYKIFSTLKISHPIARFLPNSYLLMAVASESTLSFYSVFYHEFSLISKINTSYITDFVYKPDINSIIVSTNNILFIYDFEINLPQVYSMEDDYVFYTCLTLCLFSVISKRQNQEALSGNDFVTKDTSYVLPDEKIDYLPKKFIQFCPLSAPGWEKLDENGRKFIFSYNFAKFYCQENIVFFSIWALLCNCQHLLYEPLQYESCKDICLSYAPLWIKENNILRMYVENIIMKTYPSTDELDMYLLLCVVVGKFSVASRVANMHGNIKIANCLLSDENNESKLEKSAFEALKIHRFEIASIFFLLLKKNLQAVQVLKSNPMLELLVSRLLAVDLTDQIMTEHFSQHINGFFIEFNKDTYEAADRLINYKLPNCEDLSLEAHRCEMIKEITGNIPKYLLLNMQFIPFFIKKHFIQSSTVDSDRLVFSRKRSRASFHFDFGGIGKNEAMDIGQEYDEEEEEESINDENVLIDNTHFVETFDEDIFSTSHNIVFSVTESFIVTQINKLFNVQFSETTIKLLTKIVKMISDRATIAAILFSLSFALSKSTFIIPLLESAYDFQIENYFDEFVNCQVSVLPPDLLTPFANQSTKLTQNDINIVNCLAFNKMSQNYSKSIKFDKLSILPYYFHHRHRILFKKLTEFYFSDPGIIDDIDPLNLDPMNQLQKMEKVSIHERWLVALNGSFSSPFFLDNKFNYSSTSTLRSGISPPIRGICIDKINNQKLAIVSDSLNLLKVSDEVLNGVYKADKSDEYIYYDSPFAPLLKGHENASISPTDCTKFTCEWNKNHSFKTFIHTTACDSHPFYEIFVTGDVNGNLRLWNFTSHFLQSSHSINFYDSEITDMHFNESGTSLLISDKKGRVYTCNDFINNTNLICTTEKSTSAWFNNDSQIVVVDPFNSVLNIYDTKAGNKPVFTHDLSSCFTKRYPVDVWEYKIALGCPDGRLNVFDVRNSLPFSKRMHSSRIRAIKFHQSGSFLATGGLDNKLLFINSNNLSVCDSMHDVLPHNIYDKKMGITAIAMSKQVVIVGGYSNALQAWTIVSEKGKAASMNFSTAIDLRNILNEL